jgi:glycosyltransferase involved in cell wall biosynthesis
MVPDGAGSGRDSSALRRELETLRCEHARTAARLAATLDQNIKLRRELAAMRASIAWRITAPLRYARLAILRAQTWLKSSLRALRPRALAQLALSLYRRAPLPVRVRLALHKILFRFAPRIYGRLRTAAGTAKPGEDIAPPIGERAGADDIVGEPRFRTGFRRLVAALAAHSAQHGPFTHVIALPFFSVGGAQLVATNFAATIASNGGGCLLLATDKTLDGGQIEKSGGRTLAIDLSDYFDPADAVAREHLLFAVLRLLRPKVFHVINAEAGWRLIINQGARVRQFTRLYGSIFAFQFDPFSGKKVGYAASFLADAMPFLDGLTSDNKRFIDDAIAEFGLDGDRAKFHLVYNTAETVSADTLAKGARFASALPRQVRAAPRLSVLWAGRLDAEKRPDLLLAVANACPDMDFHVYGARVVDQSVSTQFQARSNLNLHGPYSSALEVMARREHHLMMFTSRWEGLANVLIEFGALGLPIVAATVGGVGELIKADTGYPVPERPTPEHYVRALHAVRDDPETAAARSRNLLKRIAQQHSKHSFARAVAAIDGYLA